MNTPDEKANIVKYQFKLYYISNKAIFLYASKPNILYIKLLIGEILVFLNTASK